MLDKDDRQTILKEMKGGFIIELEFTAYNRNHNVTLKP